MKKFFVSLLGGLLVSSLAFASDTAGVNLTYDVLNNAPPTSVVRAGTKLTQEVVRLARARYDFSVQGGSSTGSINLLDDEGAPFKLPNKAVITNVIIDVATAPTSTPSIATIAIGANTAIDIKANTAIASYTGLLAGIPVNTAATAIKLTADRTLVASIGVASLTAGKFVVLVEYYMSQ